MPPRQPTKNRINMHDIVQQPLGALSDAVDAVIRRPENLDELEVKSIFHEISFILLRAEEALSARDETAFSALFRLLSEGLAHSEQAFEEGITMIALHGALLQTIHSIFRVIVEQEALPLNGHGTIELIQVVSSLCDGDAIKESCGVLFMPGLIKILERINANGEEASRHFHVQRAVTTALINLVKGSKKNKSRLTAWRTIAECCAASTDIFFQLQCVELLFRVARQNKSVLQQLSGAFSDDTIAALRALPNDNSLLSCMITLVESMNEGRTDVLRFRLDQVVAAETVLTQSTDAYFTPHYLIIMVTSTDADNISIPYRTVRSVTLGKDGRVIVRLEEFPVKLAMLLSRTPGMDTITLHMGGDQLVGFKDSAIREWIVAALQARKEAQRQAKAERRSPGSKRNAADPLAPHEQDRAERDADGDGAFGKGGAADMGSSGVTTAGATPSFASGSPGSSTKKQRTEAGGSSPLSANHRQRASKHASTIVNLVKALAQESASPQKTNALLAQLKRLIDAKMEVRRGENISFLNKAMVQIQELVDAARAETKENRDAWEKEVVAELARLESHITCTQDLAAAGVEKLNADLRDVRSSNQALNDRIACIEIELQQALQESREQGEGEWRAIQAVCETEVQRQEMELNQRLLYRTNPTSSIMTDYVKASGDYTAY